MSRPVVDAAYCAQGQVTLKAKERMMSVSGDGFQITDQAGRLWFSVDNKMFSLREKRLLVDASGRPVCGLQKKLISLKPTFLLTRGTDFDNPIAKIRTKTLSLHPTVNVYLNDGDREPDFQCTGNFRAKKFDVIAISGGHESVYAQIKKESRFSSAGAFLKAQLTEADCYYIEATPGADLAFLSALCIAVDELFHDTQQG